MVTTQNGIETLNFETGQLTPFCHPEYGRAENRLNDAKVGPGGAIWVGSMRMDAAKPSGSLYRVDPDGSFTQKKDGISVSNGLGWSPSQDTFYFVYTGPGEIYAYDSVAGTGAPSNRRVFTRIPAEDGRPGDLTVDKAGGVWVSLGDGWALRRYHPDGTLDMTVGLPIPRPTSLCFGGPDLSTLFITSAQACLPASPLSKAPLSGGVFHCKPGFTGLVAPSFAPE